MANAKNLQRRLRSDPPTRSVTYSNFANNITLPFESTYLWIYGDGVLEVQFAGESVMKQLTIPVGSVLMRESFGLSRIGSGTTVTQIVVFG